MTLPSKNSRLFKLDFRDTESLRIEREEFS